MKKYYDVLNISENASLEEARMAYKREVKKYHPDLYEGNKEFAESKTAEINVAFDMVAKDIELAAANLKASVNKSHTKSNNPFTENNPPKPAAKKKAARETVKPKPQPAAKGSKPPTPPKAQPKPKPKAEKTEYELFREKFGFPPEFENTAKKPEPGNAETEKPAFAESAQVDGSDMDYNSAAREPEERIRSAYARVTAEEFRGEKEINADRLKAEKTVAILDTYDSKAGENQFEKKSKGESQKGKAILNLLLGGILVGVLIIIILLAI